MKQIILKRVGDRFEILRQEGEDPISRVHLQGGIEDQAEAMKIALHIANGDPLCLGVRVED